MSSDWHNLYLAALNETDPNQLQDACEQAQTAINNRLLELAKEKSVRDPEQEQLEEALRQLVIRCVRPSTQPCNPTEETVQSSRPDDRR